MSSIKERLEKMKREAKERSRQLARDKDLMSSSGSGISGLGIDSKVLAAAAGTTGNASTSYMSSHMNGTAASSSSSRGGAGGSSAEMMSCDENARPPPSAAAMAGVNAKRDRIGVGVNATPSGSFAAPLSGVISGTLSRNFLQPIRERSHRQQITTAGDQQQQQQQQQMLVKEKQQQLQQRQQAVKVTPLTNSRKCSSSCSKLPPMGAIMETPLSSNAAGGGRDAMAAVASRARIAKSASSANILYGTRGGNNNGTGSADVGDNSAAVARRHADESSVAGGADAGGGGDAPRRLLVAGQSYTLLNQLGKGGSSVVYQAFSSADRQCVAIKCVDLTNADEAIALAYENEIHLLATLQGSPYVIKMFAYETRNNRLYVVMERGDIDLATFMRKRFEQIDDKFIKYHWQEMLRCVKVIHDRSIVHSDLKPANFLFVGASLKLIDFGIASNIPSNKTSVVKDVQIGTLNYMSPEAINGFCDEDGGQHFKIPLKSDVWSLGCILYAMIYGATPFQHLLNQIAKIRAISSDSVPIKFGPLKDQLLLDVLKRCLVRNVKERASVDELLDHPYLQS